ncbi:MAG: hypothetical protein J2O49_08845 [Sciscionella sp.]|nr:hypothetical protein [Sciscionella sp.]
MPSRKAWTEQATAKVSSTSKPNSGGLDGKPGSGGLAGKAGSTVRRGGGSGERGRDGRGGDGRGRDGLAASAGVLTAALVMLALAVGVTDLLTGPYHFAGPGSGAVAAQVSAAVLAVLAQLVVRRASGRVRYLAALAIVVLFAGMLWYFWWR